MKLIQLKEEIEKLIALGHSDAQVMVSTMNCFSIAERIETYNYDLETVIIIEPDEVPFTT